MKCVIPCAGESKRMLYVPKTLISINGKPLITHIIDMWKDSVDGFIFVLRRSQAYLWEYLPENSAVVFQDKPLGLADAILRTESVVNGRFMVVLGDCIQKGTFDIPGNPIELGIGVWATNDFDECKKNYLVEISPEGLVCRLEEKPKVPNGLCGMGIYFLDQRVFRYIRKQGGEFTDILQAMVNEGERIYPIFFRGNYVNVGSPEDLKKAERIICE